MSLLDDVKAALGITGTEKDALLERTIAAVLQRMRKVTARCLYPVHVVTHSCPGTSCCRPCCSAPVRLAELPFVSLMSVELDGVVQDLTGFSVTPSGHLMRDGRPVISSNVVVVYEAGYSELPADLFDAMVSLCGRAVAGGGGMMRKVSIVDVGSIDYGDAGRAGSDVILGDYEDVIEAYAWLPNVLGGDPNCDSVAFVMPLGNP